MLIKALKSKLHRATVTETQIDYPGSIKVDPELMEAAGILPYEAVLIADITNGSRCETYVIPAEAGSKDVIIMGAAARMINTKDIVIIIDFGLFTPEEMKTLKPKVVAFDENNEIISKKG